MALAEIYIRLQAGDPASVLVNGNELADSCRRIVVEHRAGEMVPTVYLEIQGNVTLNGEAVVTTQQAGGDVREFVASLDPSVLEAAALEKLGGFSGVETTGEAFLQALQEAARGYDGS